MAYTGSAAALASLALYVRACRSDPGVITRANVDRHSSSFARDGVLYSPRTCGTCHISKPARSKHCRICDRQVGGRVLGALLGKRILAADMTASGAWALARLRRGQMVYVSDSWRECLSYTFARYPRQPPGMTGNEAGKWRELRRDLRRQAAFDRGVAAEIDLMPRNAYDAGIVANLAQVLFPARSSGCAKRD
ncbi:hypothetical protein QBZ16_003457 [Prototheca wickerhamii]|uniref:Uncharacterized protein n=1 Tax=Prototheca wickerhamii TaxID=3111 RepID=A0AAD9MIL8_PROWI|nr:hypothetical protein QBZ16_003457 [Prototheca wickerhamii]